MTGRRVARVQDLLKEEVSNLLLFKVRDPRLRSVSITGVRMSPDLKRAVISYCFFDEEATREGVEAGLSSASGFFRREVGRSLGLKFVPELVFRFDQSLEYAQHMDQLLRSIKETDEGKGNEEEA